MEGRTDYVCLGICSLVHIVGAYKSFVTFCQWNRKQGHEVEGRSVGEKWIEERKEDVK